jgi:hypothetical protein
LYDIILSLSCCVIYVLNYVNHSNILLSYSCVEHQKCPRGRSGRPAVVVRTLRACAESVRVPSFSWDLLPKTAGLAREIVCSGSRPPLYIDVSHPGFRATRPGREHNHQVC